MSEKIYYETNPNGYVCLTDCPHGFSPSVGSSACESCEYFVENNEDENYVVCDFNKEK